MWTYFSFESPTMSPWRYWDRRAPGQYFTVDSLGQVWTIRLDRSVAPSQGQWRAYGPHCQRHQIACAKSGHRLAYQVVEDYIVPVGGVTARPAEPCKECARNVKP